MKKKNVGIMSVVVVLLLLVTGYYFFIYAPHQRAVASYEKAVTALKDSNKDIESLVSDAEKLVKTNAEPLEPATLEDLKTAISDTDKEIRKASKMESKTEDIEKQVKELTEPVDYAASQKNLSEKMNQYQQSVTQLKQITNPTNAFVEERLREIETITGVQSVTETHDPNGQLNKQGGYTASIYFSDSQVTEAVDGTDIAEKGTDAGGDIEVYPTKEDAEKRNIYLLAFDGNGFLNPGSHYVYGTLVIRTSRHLTGTQQKELTEKIYQKLIELK